MHIKRRNLPDFWPVQRTGTKYLAVPTHEERNSIPLIVFMRDVLELVRSSKELKTIVNEKKVMINGKIVNEERYPLLFFDTISLPALKKYYRVSMKGKRFNLQEIKESEAGSRIYKVIGLKKISGGKIQVNMDGGKNIISSEKIKTGDFVLFDNIKKKVSKIVSLIKGTEIIVIAGKHSGKVGKIKEIAKEGEENIAMVKTEDGEIKANIKNLYAIA